jgi:hypothetical protein
MRAPDVMLRARQLVHGFDRGMRADQALLAARDFRAAPLANSLYERDRTPGVTRP